MVDWARVVETKWGRHLALGTVFAAVAAATLLAALAASIEYLSIDLRRQNEILLTAYSRPTDAAFAILDRLGNDVSGEPCSSAFLEGMNRIAFQPGGIGTIAYGTGERIECSTVRGIPAGNYVLGAPDVAAGENRFGADFWLGRSEDLLGFSGMAGTLVRRAGFIAVLPEAAADALPPALYEHQVVFTGKPGEAVHRAGVRGLYLAAAGSKAFDLATFSLALISCSENGSHCAVSRATPADMLRHSALPWAAIALLALVAGFLGRCRAARAIDAYCSFEARFLRGFEAGRVTSLLQPIMAVDGARIIGAEALARWRDSDGTLVTPDRFLPIVCRKGEGRRLTRLVVDDARRAILGAVSLAGDFRLSINVHPGDYSFDFLYPLLGEPLPLRGGGMLRYAVEIVETEGIDIASIVGEMLALRARGIETYIDDFGVGYANIGNLAALPLDGVKFDRSFAMANESSALGRMLPRALELVFSAGHKVIVEGVETGKCFERMCANRQVDCVQGFYIGRPMTATELAVCMAGASSEGSMSTGLNAGASRAAGLRVRTDSFGAVH